MEYLTAPVDFPLPINVALFGSLAATSLFFMVSFGMDNSSMFDQYWAMAPVPIAYYYAFNSSTTFSADPLRKSLVLIAVTVWAIRLFSLFFVKEHRPNDPGGALRYGKEHEDARYKAFRAQFGRFYWPYSMLFLHFFPALMIHWGCLPLYYALSSNETAPFGIFDVLAFLFTMGAITLETVADNQLMRFMEKKKTDKSLKICTTGVWSWSRHPNYFGEFSFWLGLFFFGLAAAGKDALWTGIGAIVILFLFVGYSVPFMEERMGNRPGWAEYAKSTSSFVPLPPIKIKSD